MDRDIPKESEQSVRQREAAGWAQLNKTAHFQPGPGTIAGCIADGVGDPRRRPDYPQSEQASTGGCNSTSPALSSLTVAAQMIMHLRRAGGNQLREGEHNQRKADCLEAFFNSLPAVLSEKADEGLRYLLQLI